MVKSYKKLVRDKIPEIIKANNETPVTRKLTDAEYLIELEKKLFEEYEEVMQATNPTDKLEELADMIEVISALAKLENSSIANVLEIAEKKRQKRGSFEDKIFLETVIESNK